MVVCGLVKWQVPNLTLELLIWSKRSWLCSISCCLPSLAIAPPGCHRNQLHFLLLLPKCRQNQSVVMKTSLRRTKGGQRSFQPLCITVVGQLNRLKMSMGLETCPFVVKNGYIYTLGWKSNLRISVWIGMEKQKLTSQEAKSWSSLIFKFFWRSLKRWTIYHLGESLFLPVSPWLCWVGHHSDKQMLQSWQSLAVEFLHVVSILWENNNYCEHPTHTHAQAYHKQHDVMFNSCKLLLVLLLLRTSGFSYGQLQ